MGKDGAVILMTVRLNSTDAQRQLKTFNNFVTGTERTTARESSRIIRDTERQRDETNKRRLVGMEKIKQAEAGTQREIQKSLLQTERIRTETTRRAIIEARELARQNKPQTSGFMRGVLSSRFSLPGTNGNVMPLVGQTLRGGAGSVVGMAAVGAASALATQFAKGVENAANLEQSLNVLQVASNATSGEMEKMRAKARELGADLSLPATSSNDAAKAMLELSKAGLSTTDTMNGAKGALQLAAAAQVSVGEAAGVAASNVKAFSLAGSETIRVADLLAATANSSLGEITDMADAGQQAAAVFHSAKIPIEEMYTAIGLMANAGIKGSDAGTSLKTMLLALTAPTDEATKVMKALGISIFDSHGQMRPFREIIGQVSGAMVNLSEEQRAFALKTIFGTDAIRAANIVMAQGVEKYDQMRRKVTETGAASKMAEAQMKGLKGAQEGFNSAVQSFTEKVGAPFLRTLTDIVRLGTDFVSSMDAATGSVNALGDAPGWAMLKGNMRDLREYLQLSSQVAKVNASPMGKAGNARSDAGLIRDARRAIENRGNDVFHFVSQNQVNELFANANGDLSKYGLDKYQMTADYGNEGKLIEQLKKAEALATKEANDIMVDLRTSRLQDAMGSGDSEERRLQGRSDRERTGQVTSPTANKNGAKNLADLMNDAKKPRKRRGKSDAERAAEKAKREREKTAREAEEARLRTQADRLRSQEIMASTERDSNQAIFTGRVESLSQAETPAAVARIQKHFADDIKKLKEQDEAAALSALRRDKQRDSKNVSAAYATYRDQQSKDQIANKKRTDEAEKAVADALKRLADATEDAAEKQREATREHTDQQRKQFERNATAYNAFLDEEEKRLNLAMEQSKTWGQDNALIQELVDVKQRRAALENQLLALESAQVLGMQIAQFASGQPIADRADVADSMGGSVTSFGAIARRAQNSASEIGTFAAEARAKSLERFKSGQPNATTPGNRAGREQGREIEQSFQRGIEGLFGALGQSEEGRKAALKDFLTGQLENLQGVAASSMSEEFNRVLKRELTGKEGVLKGVFEDLTKGLKDNVKGLDLSAKGLLSTGMGLYGLANILGAGGKKKQTSSIIGGVLGFAAGSIIPGIGNLQGAGIGAAVGSFFGFANGTTRMPMNMASWVGEREAELVVPSAPNTMVLNQKQVGAVLSATGATRDSGIINNFYGPVSDRLDVDIVTAQQERKRQRKALVS